MLFTVLIAVVFPNLLTYTVIFALAFVIVYFTLCRFVGKWDYTKGTWKEQSALMFKNNPEWNEMKQMVQAIKETQEEYWFAVMAAIAQEIELD